MFHLRVHQFHDGSAVNRAPDFDGVRTETDGPDCNSIHPLTWLLVNDNKSSVRNGMTYQVRYPFAHLVQVEVH